MDMEPIPFDLENLYITGFISHLDYHFARTLGRLFKEENPVITASCALVSRALSSGDICLDIPDVSGTGLDLPEEQGGHVILPDQSQWLEALSRSSMISDRPGSPLVLDQSHRLFLARYYDFQERLAETFANRFLQKSKHVDEGDVRDLIRNSFSDSDPRTETQRRAVQHALSNTLTIISGGPGTGKTFVSRQIAALFQQLSAQKKQPRPEILCVAPTGKAASKMENGRTIHSVLGPRPGQAGFRHNKKNPLRADVVIIDEASMIDVVLMTRLLEAVPPAAHIVMLGDMNQLASVQAGSVFSSIFASRRLNHATFVLTHNFRSAGKKGINQLSEAINQCDASTVERILTESRYTDVRFLDLKAYPNISDCCADEIKNGYSNFLSALNKASALEQIDDFRVLCAHNSGRYGTLSINHLCENILRSQMNFDIDGNHLKRIIMVKSNDYKRGLFNGDTGFSLKTDHDRENIYIHNQEGAAVEFILPGFPAHETAFAMTIHKSQGSEFNHVLIILPEKLSPVTTRQLLYTGVTRARHKVTIAGDLNMIRQAIQVSAGHQTGLTDALEARLKNIEM